MRPSRRSDVGRARPWRRRREDNDQLPAKLELRRYFLRTYHAHGPIEVFDACQGSGTLWRILRKEFPVARYWGVDVKAKTGRLRIDSAKILTQPGLTENVIDVDTYGAPWRHYFALLPNVHQPTTVFLTVGHLTINGGVMQREALEALGLSSSQIDLIPHSLGARLRELALHYCLAKAEEAGELEAVEIAEALPAGKTARYFGVHLRPTGEAEADSGKRA